MSAFMILIVKDPVVNRLHATSGMSEGRENEGKGVRVESCEQPGQIMQRGADHERLIDAEDSDFAGAQPASGGGNLGGVQPDAAAARRQPRPARFGKVAMTGSEE